MNAEELAAGETFAAGAGRTGRKSMTNMTNLSRRGSTVSPQPPQPQPPKQLPRIRRRSRRSSSLASIASITFLEGDGDDDEVAEMAAGPQHAPAALSKEDSYFTRRRSLTDQHDSVFSAASIRMEKSEAITSMSEHDGDADRVVENEIVELGRHSLSQQPSRRGSAANLSRRGSAVSVASSRGMFTPVSRMGDDDSDTRSRDSTLYAERDITTPPPAEDVAEEVPVVQVVPATPSAPSDGRFHRPSHPRRVSVSADAASNAEAAAAGGGPSPARTMLLESYNSNDM